MQHTDLFLKLPAVTGTIISSKHVTVLESVMTRTGIAY